MHYSSVLFSEDGSLKWDKVYKTYYEPLCYFAKRLINNDMEAEDIALDSLLKLWILKDRFCSEPNVKAFLYITTRNACFDYLKRLQCWLRIRKELQFSLRDNVEPVCHHDNRELLHIVYNEIENLPPKTKVIFKMSFFEGLKTSEIAMKLNIQKQTVRNSKAKAIIQLRSLLSQKMKDAV